MEYISIHHSMTPLSMNPERAIQVITENHIERFGHMPSIFNASNIGYNFTIDKFGTIKQWRAVGEETMAQKGYNFNTISICLLANLDTESPTVIMEETLKNHIVNLRKSYGEKLAVKGHRFFTGSGSLCQYENAPGIVGCPHKSCPGYYYTDTKINELNNLGSVSTPATPPSGQFVFTKNMKMGEENDDIYELSKVLVKQGFLHEFYVGKKYDTRIRDAVVNLQEKNKIGTAIERKMIWGSIVGPKTRAFLNTLR